MAISEPRKRGRARGLDDLVAGARELVDTIDNHARLVAGLEPLLARFLRTEILPESYCHPASGTPTTAHPGFRYHLHLLHQDPRDRFNIVSAIWLGSGGGSGIHDHGGRWVVEGVYRGQIHTTRYRRRNGGERPGLATLEATASTELRPTDVAHVLSPDEEIHEFTNRGIEPAVSLHIYGGDVRGKTIHYFDLAAGTAEAVTHETHYESEPGSIRKMGL